MMAWLYSCTTSLRIGSREEKGAEERLDMVFASLQHQFRETIRDWETAPRTLSTIRLGGRAELTIDYNDYEIAGASTVTSLPALRSSPPIETARAEK
jgi:hypothetical protein